MITRSKIQQNKKIKDLIPKDDKKHKQFQDHLFFGKENQTSTIYIASKPGSGKTQMTLQMIQRLCRKEDSQVFWISDITGLDKKVTEFLNDYHVQYYSLQDVKNGCLRELFEFLKKDRMETDEYFPYIRWFFVFDDIILNNKAQEDLMIFIKTLRHFQAAACVMIGQDFVHTAKKSMRNIFGVQILFQGVNLDRMKDVIYKQLTLPGLTYEDFLDIYKDATKQQYSALIIDNRGQFPVFQRNFDEVYNIDLDYDAEDEIKQVQKIKNPFVKHH